MHSNLHCLIRFWGYVGMAALPEIVISVGIVLLGLLFLMAFINQKFPSVEDTKPFEWINHALVVSLLLCVPIFVVSLIIESANAPSAYEVCMQGMENAKDPDAIAYMEDYCYQQNSG